MALKPRHKRRIFWSIICAICAIGLGVIMIPPMFTLNKIKPMVEKSIYEQTNIPTKLNGNIHFSLIGGATIVAHDVSIQNANIGSIMFSIPFSSLLDLKNAKLNDAVIIYDADITVDKLLPASFNHNIEIYDSNITFMGRKFHIIRADFTNGQFHGTIRSKDHKYDVEFIGDTFNIKNKNKALEITGQMYSDGSLRGYIELTTNNINEWFGFSEPKIPQTISLTMKFEWNGGDGYKFTNIESEHFSGNIEIFPNGDKDIQLVSNDIDFDFSFLGNPNRLIKKTNFNLDLYGRLKFYNHTFNHIRVAATGTKNALQIGTIIADDIAITGGTITPEGAHNIMITLPINKTNAMCLFSGTPTDWQCDKFTYGNLWGSISVSNDTYNVIVESDKKMPDIKNAENLLSKLGKYGTVKFKFSDLGGIYKNTKSGTSIFYNFADNKTLEWLKITPKFLPKFMLTDAGNFSWSDGMMAFIPHNKQWQLSMSDNYFVLSGNNLKKILPNIDLRAINDSKYIVSGFYDNDKISNLNIKALGNEFSGSVSGNNITLHTEKLFLNKIISKSFLDNYSEQEFLTNAPLMTMFEIPVNISLSANGLVYDNAEYKNFVYSLKQNIQILSISDSTRGNILTTIERNKNKYDISVQLNQFKINGDLLSKQMPLNIRDTFITGELKLTTNGKIAHDIYYNMAGDIDVTFSDGYIIGLSMDNFYASAENITSLNAEYALSNALGGGETRLKQMRLIGTYTQDNFITTEPIELSMLHSSAIGGLAITNGQMTAEFDLTLRGTGPVPTTIEFSILPDGGRNYSLSEIMRNLDTGFMRAFVKTHNKF